MNQIKMMEIIVDDIFKQLFLHVGKDQKIGLDLHLNVNELMSSIPEIIADS